MARGKYEKKAPAKQHTEDSRQGRIWKRILIGVAVVLLLFALLVGLALHYVLNKFGSFDDPALADTTPMTDEFDTDSTIAGQETIETMDATDVTFDEVSELVTDKNTVNIMLIGQDARPGEGRSRSDTMLLVTLNPSKNAIQMTSFMRDTYVQIPGYLDNRLNVAYRYGGTELMNETFLKNFGIHIDGNVMVDFKEFEGIIDMLGGVDMELSEEEVGYMLRHDCNVQVGMNHLSGEDALTFVRMRNVSGGDYGRTERQRRVVSALIDSVRSASWMDIKDLIDAVLPRVVTNIDSWNILSYAAKGFSLLADGAQIQTLRIPADDAHYGTMIDGMSVLLPDLEMCREDLEEFLN